MATQTRTTLMHGRIPASALSTTKVYPIDLIPAEPIPGLANRPVLRMSIFDATEQAAAMNAVLVALNGLLEQLPA